MEGETLDEVLARRGRLPAGEAVRLMRQVLDGLQHLHDRRMVHRDMKPANMMLTPAPGEGKPDTTWDATVKVLDIGLGRELFDDDAPEAQIETQLTQEGSVLGTPDYLAPEQAKDARSSDIRADIYSVGCVLYHCLTGRPPYSDTSIMAQMLKHATESPAPLASLVPDTPAGLQAVLDRFLAKSPAERYQTPVEAADALKPFATGGATATASKLVPAFKDWLDSESQMELPKNLPPKTAPKPALPAVSAKPSSPPKPGTKPAPAVKSGPVAPPPTKPAAVAPRPVPQPVPVPVPMPVPVREEVDVELITDMAGAAVVAPVERPLWSPDRRDWLMLAAGATGVLTSLGSRLRAVEACSAAAPIRTRRNDHRPTAMILHARHYATGHPVAVTVDGGRITAVAASDERPTRWIAPAFFDPQINGCGGIAFNSPALTADHIRAVADVCRAHGIAAFCPTLITGSFAAITHGFATLTRTLDADADLARRLPCFHLEGPYLAAADGPRGAHPKEHARDPDWDEFRRWQDAAAGRIRMVTLAPERPGTLPFIEKVAAAGVVVAIGHTAATGPQIHAAVAAGARTSTHLGNGCHATLPRHDNYVWEQLACDDLWASIITDGHHLPAAVVKCFIRAKGVGRTLLTCDAGSLAGMPPGRYREWGGDLDVLPSGKIVVAGTPFLAGSGHFTDVCVANVIRAAGVTLADAVDMAAIRPRQLLGLPLPAIEAGHAADLMLFDWEPDGVFTVRDVL